MRRTATRDIELAGERIRQGELSCGTCRATATKA
jgi:cytochrome P450